MRKTWVRDPEDFRTMVNVEWEKRRYPWFKVHITLGGWLNWWEVELVIWRFRFWGTTLWSNDKIKRDAW